MDVDRNYDQMRNALIDVLCSREHQLAQCIVRLYHNGISIPVICQKLNISQQKAYEVLL